MWAQYCRECELVGKVLMRYVDTLSYFDGIHAFFGTDDSGRPYYCVLVDEGSEDTYLCSRIRPTELTSLLSDYPNISTRLLFNGATEIYTTKIGGTTENDILELTPIDVNDLPSDWLPDD